MKSIFGFRDSAGAVPMEAAPSETETKEVPVRSLVQIQFPGRMPLTFYNDRFDLQPGDLVYVSGKLEGMIGKVETVTTRFRIRKSDYEQVLRRLDTDIHGEFEPAGGYMVTRDMTAISPERFRTWVMPPEREAQRLWYVDGETGQRKGYWETEPEDDLIVGDGYALSLHDLEHAPDVREVILSRAKGYVGDNRVKYLWAKQGRVKAYVLGSAWYEVEFSRSDDDVTELYCDCPYPALCKHALAVLLTLRDRLPPSDESCIAVENDWFWNLLSNQPKRITL